MDSVNNMDHFDWQQQLRSGIYSHYRHAHRRAIIGITANYSEGTCKILDYYYKAVVAAGGTPVLIPPVKDQQVIANTLQHIDALILSGGADYNPLYAGEQPEKTLGGINDERDLPELWITRMAYHRQLPILGICRGIQTLVMALDGEAQWEAIKNMDMEKVIVLAKGAKFVFKIAKVAIKIMLVLDKLHIIDLSQYKQMIVDFIADAIKGIVPPVEPEAGAAVA